MTRKHMILGPIGLIFGAVLGCAVGQPTTPAPHQLTTASAPPPVFSQDGSNQNALEPVGRYERYQNHAYIKIDAVWTTRRIPVCWEEKVPINEASWVKDAVIRTWQQHSQLSFGGWGTCAPNASGIRIHVEDTGPHTIGLGTEIADKPNGMVLNFSFQNWGQPCVSSDAYRRSCIESIAVHEFGHALAFAHEQNRPDTPGECALQRQGGNGTLLLTPYDPTSVMNYCNPVYNNNGVLSDYDVRALQALYGARAAN